METQTANQTYSFTPWPAEDSQHSTAMFDLFRALTCRVEMEFSDAGFETFQESLSEAGITLREIERIPESKNQSTS